MMSKKGRARMVVTAKVTKSGMKISEASDTLGLSYGRRCELRSGMGQKVWRGWASQSLGRIRRRRKPREAAGRAEWEGQRGTDYPVE